MRFCPPPIYIFGYCFTAKWSGSRSSKSANSKSTGALIFLVVLAGFAGVDKFQQGNKVHFLGGGFVPDVAPPTRNTKAVLPLPKNPPRFFLPHLWYSLSTYLPASKYLSRCGYTQRGFVVHRFFEVNRIQYLNAGSPPVAAASRTQSKPYLSGRLRRKRNEAALD